MTSLSLCEKLLRHAHFILFERRILRGTGERDPVGLLSVLNCEGDRDAANPPESPA
jgi:hypothetical protein